MSTQAPTLQQLSRHVETGLVWLSQWGQRAWNALAETAAGEGFSSSGTAAPETGPAVILMAGGLTTLVGVMAFFMARRSLSSVPEPVNTRKSKQKARESVDIYVDGGETRGTNGGSDNGSPPAAASDPPDADTSEAVQGLQITYTVADEDVHAAWSAPRSATEEEDPPAETLEVAEVEALDPEDLQQLDEAPPAADPSSEAHRAFKRGRSAGARAPATCPTEVLDCIEEAGLGQASLLRSTPNLYELRIDRCRGCRSSRPDGGSTDARAGCPLEAGFLEGSMSRFLPGGVVVRETECRRWGDEACAFEVWY